MGQLRYLLDTNIFLELLMEQEEADAVVRLYLSEFSLYSIGIVLLRRHLYSTFIGFVNDTLVEGALGLVRLLPEDMEGIATVARDFHLDFDDAYQYVSAGKYGLTIVSFNGDFDRTELGRKTPTQILHS